jgi:DNA-binding GntR family transcriptional regulator
MVEIAYRRLQEAVMAGELRPGDRIQQDAVAAALGISRMPLREALRKLEERGFVTIRPHRGAFVSDLDVVDLESTYFVRTLLETASAAEAARRMDANRITALRVILSEAREALAAQDDARLSDLNRDFHLTGHAATENAVLLRLIGDLSLQCQRYRLLHASLGERAAIALREHEHILAAWEARDPHAASHWIEVNLRNSEAALLSSLDAGLKNDVGPVGAPPARGPHSRETGAAS